MQKHFFFQRKMILDIPKGVKDVDKVDKEEQKTNLKEEAVAVSTSQLVSHIKQSGRPVTLTVAIQDPGLTNQKLNAIIVKKKKKQVIMLGIVGVQPRGLRRMQILL